VDKAGDAAAATGAGRWTRVVVMSHNYLRDLDYLRSFLGTETSYLGVLGPRRRLDRLLADLWAQGVPPSPEDIAKVHGPAGLDLGADGPEEIALAIMAEVLAIRRGRRGGFLRERTRPLHEVLDQSGRAHARASDRASSRPPIHPERRAPGLGR
jgi:xanthine/CO dehydrogenase XdhC/CoxF family maturation factor